MAAGNEATEVVDDEDEFAVDMEAVRLRLASSEWEKKRKR
jgi:hypothetical protein